MRTLRSGLCVALFLSLAACGSSPGAWGSATREPSGTADWLGPAASASASRAESVRTDATPTDRWLQIYNEVDGAHVTQLLKELCGAAPATINGQQVTISERFSSVGRQHFRD